jgi:hypothetical protein
VRITHDLDPYVSYVPGTLVYSGPGQDKTTADDSSGSAFPLDYDGIKSEFVFEGRGGTHEISFEVVIDKAQKTMKNIVVNEGSVWFGTSRVQFELSTPLCFDCEDDSGTSGGAVIFYGQETPRTSAASKSCPAFLSRRPCT